MNGENSFAPRLTGKSPVFGVIVNFDSMPFIDMVALAGFDFVLLDAEHGPITPASAQGMIRSAKAMGLAAYVRTPGCDGYEIQRYLDIGADGIQTPQVETAMEAKALVDHVYYPPKGTRGLSMATTAGAFGVVRSAADHIALVNRALSTFATVESAVAAENIDAILAVPGLTGVSIGTGDMALSMGVPGQRSAPVVQDAVRRIVLACKGANKQVMLPATDSAGAITALQLGVTGIQFPASSIVIDRGRQILA
ncbi:MAG: HpcH/HpaI aldolase/citrate lyase family protein, partial [Hyphomicrobiaceae bacterium]